MTRKPSGRHYLEHLARVGAADLHPGGVPASARLLRALAPMQGERVLEVGCGTGGTLVRLAASLLVTVYGIDHTPAMLAAARLRVRVAGVRRRTVLVRADGAGGLPFADRSFDRVYAESVLGFQPAAAARLLLGEIHRVLRPGGRFVANEAVWRAATDASTVSAIYQSSVRDFGLAQSSEEGWTVEDWSRCMEDAGLLLRSREPLKGSAAPTPTFPSTHRATLAAALLGVAGCVRRVLDPEPGARVPATPRPAPRRRALRRGLPLRARPRRRRKTRVTRSGRWRITAVAAALATLSACEQTPLESPRDPPPEVVATTVSSNQGGIFRTLSVQLDRGGAVIAEYWAADGARLQVQSAGVATWHRLFLPRLSAEREYGYEVRGVSDDGESGPAVRGTFRTGALPESLTPLELSVIGRPSFDLLLLEVGAPTGPHLPVIVDTRGNVVWHGLVPGRVSSGFTRFEDSLFVFNAPDGLHVVSPRSQAAVASLTRARGAARTGVHPFSIHHDVVSTSAGTLLFLVEDPAVARDTVWTGEAIWEWNPRTDALTRRWRSIDFLNPATDRAPRSSPDDWLHANSLSLGPRGNVVVSLFWLHEVLSIAPDWRSLEWRLGGPASTFRGVERAMEAGQHTAAEVAPNRVLLFDNGLDRAQGRFSRALEIALDRGAGTAAVAWEFRPLPDIYAPIVSSARRLPNGNTVVAFGLAAGIAAPSAGAASGPLAVYEVTPTGEVPWRMELVRGAQLLYRATPLSSVAGERWVCPPGCSPAR